MKEFTILISKTKKDFQEKFEKKLSLGWKPHGYTQYPLELSVQDRLIDVDGKSVWKNVYVAKKGQWQQAFIK
tara:strand:- start:74 stop:289 length:216 start_codon:yes stop_codon:yes gene_type:complete